MYQLVLLGIVGGAASQIGDLSASLIKRFVGIKDYGNIMPGHGGILDRFDSILFAAPVVYYYIVLFLR
jgi:phosphatidate cytidylyltransferase